jgi:hypothetical protein
VRFLVLLKQQKFPNSRGDYGEESHKIDFIVFCQLIRKNSSHSSPQE